MFQAAAVWGLGLAALVWLLWKLWQRFRFNALRAVPHITPDELIEALGVDAPPLLLDLRGPLMIAEAGPIPGAIAAEHDSLLQAVSERMNAVAVESRILFIGVSFIFR